MIKKRLIISTELKQKVILSMPEETNGQRLNKLGKLLITYPQEAKIIDPETGLSRVKWFYDCCGNIRAHKLAMFANDIDSGDNLDGRSWYVMVDMYKIAAYLYECENESIIRDDSFDRLGKFLEKNVQRLIEMQIIPRLINRDALTSHTGMTAAYSLKDNDKILAKQVLTMIGVIRNGYKKASGDSNSSESGRNVGRSATDTQIHSGKAGRTFKLFKRVAKE